DTPRIPELCPYLPAVDTPSPPNSRLRFWCPANRSRSLGRNFRAGRHSPPLSRIRSCRSRVGTRPTWVGSRLSGRLVAAALEEVARPANRRTPRRWSRPLLDHRLREWVDERPDNHEPDDAAEDIHGRAAPLRIGTGDRLAHPRIRLDV